MNAIRVNPNPTPDLLAALAEVQQQVNTATLQLATGSRINQPSDDPAGAAQLVQIHAPFQPGGLVSAKHQQHRRPAADRGFHPQFSRGCPHSRYQSRGPRREWHTLRFRPRRGGAGGERIQTQLLTWQTSPIRASLFLRARQRSNPSPPIRPTLPECAMTEMLE